MGRRDPRPLTLDAGALIKVEAMDRRVVVLLQRAIDRGARLIVPVGALAQVWRDGSRQTRLAALLEDPAIAVEPIDLEMAKASGELCGARGSADIVDASVVLTCRRYRGTILTSDPNDLRQLDPRADLVFV